MSCGRLKSFVGNQQLSQTSSLVGELGSRPGGLVTMSLAPSPHYELRLDHHLTEKHPVGLKRTLTDWPSTMPRDIFSRSAIVSARRDRRRGGGMIPPLGLKCAKMQEDGLPKARPIDFRPSPFFQRSQSSAL